MTVVMSATASIQQPGWSLDHVGHAVRDIDSAISKYQSLFSASIVVRESLQSDGVDVAFLQLPNTLIELIAPQPAPNGNPPLIRFLDKRGEGLHHYCFFVPSVASELARLEKLGVELIDTIPRLGSRGMSVAFLHPKSTNGVLIELCSPSA